MPLRILNLTRLTSIWILCGASPISLTFYLDWLQVAKEEAKHFRLLRQRLSAMGYDYGNYTAHNGLWDMAEKTKDDLLARWRWYRAHLKHVDLMSPREFSSA